MNNLRILVLSFTLVVVLASCSSPGGENTGNEYMPDMAHSLAVEANTYNYYYYNTWDKESTVELAKLVYPRSVPEGTVPRGYAAGYLPGRQAPESLDDAELMRGSVVDADNMSSISVPTNGHVPYYYDDTAEGRLKAIAELRDNPFPITEEGLIRGANLYNIFCAICHGNQGNGLGYLYDDEQNPNAKYPLAPANFIQGDLLTASNGRYYNAIYHGYNAMGAYRDKLNYEERWQVIHFIRSLQAKETKTEYSAEANTLNRSFGIPGAKFDPVAMRELREAQQAEEAGQLTDNAAAGAPAGNQLKKK